MLSGRKNICKILINATDVGIGTVLALPNDISSRLCRAVAACGPLFLAWAANASQEVVARPATRDILIRVD